MYFCCVVCNDNCGVNEAVVNSCEKVASDNVVICLLLVFFYTNVYQKASFYSVYTQSQLRLFTKNQELSTIVYV